MKTLGSPKLATKLNARLEERRQMAITPCHRRQGVVVYRAVEREDATVRRLSRIVDGVSDLGTRVDWRNRRLGTTAGKDDDAPGEGHVGNR
jgi:hypothetical protein